MPKENYWNHKNRISKELYMDEKEPAEDSFTRGMNDLNKFADDVFRSDLRH